MSAMNRQNGIETRIVAVINVIECNKIKYKNKNNKQMLEMANYVENRKVDAVSTASSFLEFGRLQLPVRSKKEHDMVHK
jgi:hypothetical protein